MSDRQLSYTGLELLQTLNCATNYNALLLALILRNANGRHRMVDFGAGIGTFSKLLEKRGIDVICIESDVYLADALIRDGFTTFEGLDQVPNGSCEFIFALNVLEHIEDDRATICQLAEKLNQGGRLLVYVPAFRCLWTSLDEKLKHHRRYCRAELERLVRSSGLSVLQTRYADSLGFFAALSFKLFGNKSGNLSRRAVKLYDRYVVPLSRALDVFCDRVLGKNVYVVASKD